MPALVWRLSMATTPTAASGKTASAYLGKRDWPAYRYGENVVPFEPRPDLIAVCFETRKPDPQRARGLIDEIVKKLKLKPFATESKDASHPAMAAEGAIWVFALPARSEISPPTTQPAPPAAITTKAQSGTLNPAACP